MQKRMIMKVALSVCVVLGLVLPVMAKDMPNDLQSWAKQAAGAKSYVGLNETEKRFSVDDGWIKKDVQFKFDGVKDDVYDAYIYNTAVSWPKDYEEFAVPAGWFISVHYPQGTGNDAVDAALRQIGKEAFMANLPVDPSTLDSLNPFYFIDKAGLADKTADNGTNAQMLESFANQLLLKKAGVELKRLPKIYGDTPRFEQFLTTYVITKPSKNYISVGFTDWFDTGGAHPDWAVRTVSYDLTTGKQLTLGDLVKDVNIVLPAIKNKLAQLALDQYGKETVANFLSDDYLMVFGQPAKVDSVPNVMLTPEGLTLIYDRYGLAPGYLGNIFVNIPKKELDMMGFNAKYWE